MLSTRETDPPITDAAHHPDQNGEDALLRHAVRGPDGGLANALLTLGVGVWLGILSLLGLHLFHRSDYFHHRGAYPHGWVGYTTRTFVGLTVFLATAGAAVALVVRGAVTSSLYSPQGTQRVLLTVFGALLVCAGGLGLVWGWESMKCLVIFCVDKSVYVEVPHERPEAGLGFLSVLGMSALFTLAPLGLTLVAAALDLHKRDAGRCPHGLRCGRAGLAILVGLSLTVAFAVVTFYVPNSWEYFVAARIANNAQLTVSTLAHECDDFRKTTCPEVPWAWMKTKAVRLSDSLVLKMYPSNVIFFSYLCLFGALSFLLTSCHTTRLFCRRTPFPALPLNNGQWIGCGLTTGMLLLFFLYWHLDHNYNGRFSVLHACLGTSWEASLWAHQALGYGMLAATVGHMVMWYVFYAQSGNFPHDVFAIPPRTEISADNFTVPLVSLATWFLLLTTGLFAYPPLRRQAFHLLYSLHVAGSLVIVPAVLWHAAAAWEYLLPGLTVYGIDMLLCLYYSSRKLDVLEVRLYGDVVQVRFHLPRGTTPSQTPTAAGAFVFVNVPELSVLEWHPFTLVEDSHHSRTACSIYVKPTGRAASWTRRFHRLCCKRSGEPPLMVCQGVVGGTAQRLWHDVDHVIFVVGGVGITPCFAVLQSLLSPREASERQVHVSLLWATRDEPLLCHFQSLLGGMVPPSADYVSVRLFCSRGGGGEGRGDRFPVLAGRPDVGSEVGHAVRSRSARQRALLFACGPETLTRAAEEAATAHKVYFHTEVFLF